jgi:hypothetical protein
MQRTLTCGAGLLAAFIIAACGARLGRADAGPVVADAGALAVGAGPGSPPGPHPPPAPPPNSLEQGDRPHGDSCDGTPLQACEASFQSSVGECWQPWGELWPFQCVLYALEAYVSCAETVTCKGLPCTHPMSAVPEGSRSGLCCYPGEEALYNNQRKLRCVCAVGRTNCPTSNPTACVNTLIDPNNCGTCGNSVGQGNTCCNGQVVSLLTDPNNCGTCGNSVGQGNTCCNGAGVTLGPTEACCSGAVVSLTADPSCGSCNVSCTFTQEICCATSGQKGTCVNTQTDQNHCGACGTVCAANQDCCGGACLQRNTAQNCSACTACNGGETCCSSSNAPGGFACFDPNDEQVYIVKSTGQCCDKWDRAHCGGCVPIVNPCPVGQPCMRYCQGGLPPKYSCAATTDPSYCNNFSVCSDQTGPQCR